MTWPFFSKPEKSYWLLTLTPRSRKPLFLDNEFCRFLRFLFADLVEDIFAWVILPDHFHLLITADDPQNIIDVILNEIHLFYLEKEYSKYPQWDLTKTFIEEVDAFEDAFSLMLEEPVWQGYAEDAIDYSFSSYHDYLHRFGLDFASYHRAHRPLLPERTWDSSCVFSFLDSFSE